tara:strand:- start:18490 stop:19770 length:1281 start_codon:yes stop_codon:yes gene_type:complete
MSWLGTDYSHIGTRDEQQDALVVLSNETKDQVFAVLADGAGGHSGGRLASEAIVAVATKRWETAAGEIPDPETFLLDFFAHAQARITATGKKAGIEPRATVVAVYANGKRAVWGHSGDSRLYLFRKGQLVKRTKDHSVVQILVDQGKVREEEMGTHPDQGRLLQSLGGSDYQVPDIGSANIQGDEVIVLCSDGFWEHLPKEAIAQLSVPGKLKPPKLIKKLAHAAVSRAGQKADNTSALAIYNIAANRPAFFMGGIHWAAVALFCLLAGMVTYLVMYLIKPDSSPGNQPPDAPVQNVASQVVSGGPKTSPADQAPIPNESEDIREAGENPLPKALDPTTGKPKVRIIPNIIQPAPDAPTAIVEPASPVEEVPVEPTPPPTSPTDQPTTPENTGEVPPMSPDSPPADEEKGIIRKGFEKLNPIKRDK